MSESPHLLLVESRSIATPEDIEVDVELAGLGTRAAAAALDLFLAVLSIGVIVSVVSGLAAAGLGTAFGPAGAQIAVVISAVLLCSGLFLYWFWPEWRWDSATIGKRVFNLSVCRDGGLPMTAAAAALRTLLRLIDFVPVLYGLGFVVCCASPDRKRIGDHLAGTVVVRQRRPEPGTGVIFVAPRPPEAWIRLDIGAISDDEELLVRRFLVRRTTMEASARAHLAMRLADYLQPRVMGTATAPPPVEAFPGEFFLENIALATAARHTRWLPPSLGGTPMPPRGN